MTPLLHRPFIRRAAPLLAALLTFAPVIASAQTAIPNPLRGQPAQKIQEKAEPAPDAKPAPLPFSRETGRRGDIRREAEARAFGQAEGE